MSRTYFTVGWITRRSIIADREEFYFSVLSHCYIGVYVYRANDVIYVAPKGSLSQHMSISTSMITKDTAHFDNINLVNTVCSYKIRTEFAITKITDKLTITLRSKNSEFCFPTNKKLFGAVVIWQITFISKIVSFIIWQIKIHI